MRRRMSLGVLVLWVALASGQLMAAQSADEQIKLLREKVERLEKRVAALEELIRPLEDKLRVDGRRAALTETSRRRMRKDLEQFSRDQLAEIEKLYQVANRKWGSPEAKASLEKLIKDFPAGNRTGCAVLYMGQMSQGAEREKRLKAAIEKHGDCCYGDGVNVGAYARFILAHHYWQSGKKEEAAKLFGEIRQSYTDAIDHKGRLLLDMIPKEAAGKPLEPKKDN